MPLFALTVSQGLLASHLYWSLSPGIIRPLTALNFLHTEDAMIKTHVAVWLFLLFRVRSFWLGM